MESQSNPNNFDENHGNWNTGIPERNLHVNNPFTLTTGIHGVYSHPFLHGAESWSYNSINPIGSEQTVLGTNIQTTAAQTEQMLIIQQQSGQRQPADSAYFSEQNHHLVKNQTAAETEQIMRQQQSGQHQLADMSSADSAAAQLERKRKAKSEADRRYREKTKKQREDMELKLKTLEDENESLKIQVKQREDMELKLKTLEDENESLKKQLKKREDMELKVTTFEDENESLKKMVDLSNQRSETQQKALDKLGEDFVELKKKYDKQYEINRTLEAENRRFRDKYIELLENTNALVNGIGSLSSEPGQQLGQTTNISSGLDFGPSIDSVTPQPW